MNAVGVIPARYASGRFPGKPLALIAGKPMLQWVYGAARRVLPRVVVATDDRRIEKAVRAFGGEVVMTSRSCASGTDRVAEAARRIKARVYVNVQGDEPLMSSRTIRLVLQLHKDRRVQMGTAATRFCDRAEWRDPNAVKVIVDGEGEALYFSRAPLPFFRNGSRKGIPSKEAPLQDHGPVWKHLGIYSYTRDFLREFVRWPEGKLERAERLEQLRALEHGVRIRVALTPDDSIGVDRPEDIKNVERILKKRLGVLKSQSLGVKTSGLSGSSTLRLSDSWTL